MPAMRRLALLCSPLAAVCALWAFQVLSAGDATPVAQATTVNPVTADADHPTVVELYQSQGCSSCPPANAVLNRIADRPDVLALSFAVTYWDQLGWKDRFAQPAFTARQWSYARSARRGNVYTPQMIVNGRTALVGHVAADLDRAIARTPRAADGPEVTVKADSIRLTSANGQKFVKPATIWLVRYDPRTVQVPIKAGENSGRTLPHRNIVRALIRLGDWQGTAQTLALPRANAGLASAVLVQQGEGGPIIAARRL